MKYMRRFGDNLVFLLRGKNEEEFASALGFSLRDIQRIKEGRLILRSDDISEIADYFGVSRESLFEKHPERSQVHVLGEISEEAENKILDLLDTYCDLAEACSCAGT